MDNSNKMVKLPSLLNSDRKQDGSKPQDPQKSSNPNRSGANRGRFIENLFETKPSYIARKLSPEDLIEDERRDTLMNKNLDNILEEKSEDSSHTYDPDKSESELDDSKKDIVITENKSSNAAVNIFESEMLNSTKFKEHSKGPILKNGLIVKHSVVGSVELFEKYQKTLRKHQSKDSNSVDTSFNDNSRIRPMNSLSTENHSQLTAQGTLMTGGAMKQGSKVVNMEKKREPKKEIKIHRDDLVKEIDKMKIREKEFYTKMEHMVQNLPLEDKLFMSKEQRCLDQYEKVMNSWYSIVEKVNSKLGRVSADSVIYKAEDYRKRKELADAFEMIQNDDEKFGAVFWYMTLRKGKDPKEWRQGMLQDIPEGFNASVVDRPKTSLEVIRKPLSTVKASTTGFSKANQSPSHNQSHGHGLHGHSSQSHGHSHGHLNDNAQSQTHGHGQSQTHGHGQSQSQWFELNKKIDRSNREYLEKKLEANAKLLNKIKPPNMDDVQQLIVEGVNKLNCEIDAVFKGNEKRDYYNVMIPKADSKPEGISFADAKDNQEEVIAANYDKKSLYRAGAALFPQIKMP